MVAEGNWSSKSGKMAFDELMSKFPEIDAIFSANDQMALSILQTACDEKISIPMELSVVGYDGIPESEFFSPSLTTVFQNMNKLGCIAVEELARMVGESNSEEGPGDPIYQTLKTELIIRRSSKIISE